MNKILMALFILSASARADLADSFAKSLFQSKVNEVYKKAMACKPQEKDIKTNTTVTGWLKIQPPLPSWQILADLEAVAKESRTYANKVGGNDKHRHCLAGCYIAKKLDEPSAILVGWYKELQDASDCSKSTHFEKKDYEATIRGAQGAESELTCEKFCK